MALISLWCPRRSTCCCYENCKLFALRHSSIQSRSSSVTLDGECLWISCHRFWVGFKTGHWMFWKNHIGMFRTVFLLEGETSLCSLSFFLFSCIMPYLAPSNSDQLLLFSFLIWFEHQLILQIKLKKTWKKKVMNLMNMFLFRSALFWTVCSSTFALLPSWLVPNFKILALHKKPFSCHSFIKATFILSTAFSSLLDRFSHLPC